MPIYKFRCSCDNSIHTVTLPYTDYKDEMECPCGNGTMKRVFDSFSNKNGQTVQQKQFGASEKRVESGKWMKEETKKRKMEAAPDSREAVSNEYWLGNEFKEGRRKLSDF